MRKIAALLICTSLLGACSIVPDSRGTQQASAPRAQQPAPVAVAPSERQCLTELSSAGALFTPVADSYPGQGCSIVGSVQMSALSGEGSRLSIDNIGPVQCGVGTAFAAWARFGADRAARQLLGSPIQRIETMGSFSCRNVAGTTRRSAHATAGAIDIAGFILEDGRRIMVAQDWNGGTSAEKEFLRTVQRSACRRFDTVLGPEYNAAHHDHLHVEGVIDGNSFCR